MHIYMYTSVCVCVCVCNTKNCVQILLYHCVCEHQNRFCWSDSRGEEDLELCIQFREEGTHNMHV